MVPAWLLVTDVDDTLIGDDAALGRLSAGIRKARLSILPSSSRPLDSVRPDVDLPDLPIIGIAGALGTEIELDGAPQTGWNHQFAGFPADAIAATLDVYGEPHAFEFQAPAKVSYAIPTDSWQSAREAIENLDDSLRVVTSGNSNFDVIPDTAGKTSAARYVAARNQIAWHRVVTAGDSEIDAGMLEAAKGIMVGNATPALRENRGNRVYAASATHAHGILEGLVHYGVPGVVL